MPADFEDCSIFRRSRSAGSNLHRTLDVDRERHLGSLALHESLRPPRVEFALFERDRTTGNLEALNHRNGGGGSTYNCDNNGSTGDSSMHSGSLVLKPVRLGLAEEDPLTRRLHYPGHYRISRSMMTDSNYIDSGSREDGGRVHLARRAIMSARAERLWEERRTPSIVGAAIIRPSPGEIAAECSFASHSVPRTDQAATLWPWDRYEVESNCCRDALGICHQKSGQSSNSLYESQPPATNTESRQDTQPQSRGIDVFAGLKSSAWVPCGEDARASWREDKRSYDQSQGQQW